MSERRYICHWCTFYHSGQKKCTRYPEWVPIHKEFSHFCGDHEWNKIACIELRQEFEGRINDI